jgi:hypothetical protein
MSPHGPEVTPEFLRQLDLTISIARTYTNVVACKWGTPDLEIGTAITMRAGNHLFALTARHCARPDTRLFLTFGPRKRQPVPITRIICHPDPADDRDVAILEIENSDDVRAAHIEQFILDPTRNAHSHVDPTEKKHTWIIGFPASRARVTGKTLQADMLGLPGVVENESERRLEVLYREEAYTVVQSELKQLPPPNGVSGGGLWGLMEVKEGSIFDPIRHLRLTGIQYSWRRDLRHLYAVPAKAVVEFIFATFPDVRALYASIFPQVA